MAGKGEETPPGSPQKKGTNGTNGSGKDNEVSVQRVVREISGIANWPLLTKTNYTEWSLLMKIKMQARNLWDAIESGNVSFQEDRMALEALTSAVPLQMVATLAVKTSAKEAWEAIKSMRIGSDEIRKTKAQRLRREFENIRFTDGEGVDDFTMRLTNLVAALSTVGETIDESKVVEKLLRVVPKRLSQVAVAIEVTTNLTKLTLEDVSGRLRAAEERAAEDEDEAPPLVQAQGKLFLTEEQWLARMKNKQARMKNRPADEFSSRGIGNTKLWCDICEKSNHSTDRCWKTKTCNNCKKKGHIASICKFRDDTQYNISGNKEKSLFMEKNSDDDEPMLLAAEVCELAQVANEERVAPTLCIKEETLVESDLWYLDNGASNHMTGQRSKFKELDEGINGHIKFGDNSMVQIKGKGSIMLQCKNGEQRLLNEVYYVPNLCRNIISLGQLSEAGNRIVLDRDLLSVRERSGRLLMKIQRTPDRLYKIKLQIRGSNSMEKNVAMVEHKEKIFSPRQNGQSSSLNSSLCLDSASKQQPVMQPLSLSSVKSKGEFNKMGNHAAMEDVARHRVRSMGQKNHRAKHIKVWRPKENFNGTEERCYACSGSHKNKESYAAGYYHRDFVERDNCCKREDASRKQIKGEIVGVNLFS